MMRILFSIMLLLSASAAWVTSVLTPAAASAGSVTIPALSAGHAPFFYTTATSSFSGVYDDAGYLGYNIGNPVPTEPAISYTLESDYYAGGVHYMEMYWQYTSSVAGGSGKQYRPFFVSFNRDTDTVFYQYQMSGNSTFDGCGWSVRNQALTRSLLSVCAETGGDSFGKITTDAQLKVSTNGFNTSVFTLDNTTDGVNNNYINFDFWDYHNTPYTFAKIVAQNATRGPHDYDRAGSMNFYVTWGGDTSIRPLALTGNSAVLGSYAGLTLSSQSLGGYAGLTTVGTMYWCNNCNPSTNPCTIGGAGAIAVVINATPTWRCL